MVILKKKNGFIAKRKYCFCMFLVTCDTMLDDVTCTYVTSNI